LTRLRQRQVEAHAASSDPDWLQLRELLLSRLSAEDRTLVLLHYLHGFKSDELAEMTGRSPAAIRQRLSRARAKLLADESLGAAISPKGD
jgi:RNA polymerase sigma-70 factor (ECF subfamily)